MFRNNYNSDMETDNDTEVSVQRTIVCSDLSRFQLIDKSVTNGVRQALFCVRINANGVNNACLSAADFSDDRSPIDAVNITHLDVVASADFPFSLTIKSLSQQDVNEQNEKRCCKWSKSVNSETFQSSSRGEFDIIIKQIPCNIRIGRGGVLLFASDFIKAVQELKPNGGIWLEVWCTYTDGWKTETVTVNGKRVLDADADFRSGFRFGKSAPKSDKAMKAAASMKKAKVVKKKSPKVIRSKALKSSSKKANKKAVSKKISKKVVKKNTKKSGMSAPPPPPPQWMKYIR